MRIDARINIVDIIKCIAKYTLSIVIFYCDNFVSDDINRFIL
jgi:hypothetical protein